MTEPVVNGPDITSNPTDRTEPPPKPNRIPASAEPAAAAAAGSAAGADASEAGGPDGDAKARPRRRGSRGGRGRTRVNGEGGDDDGTELNLTDAASALPDELPDRPGHGRIRSPEIAEKTLVPKAAEPLEPSEPAGGPTDLAPVAKAGPPKPKIGDTRPLPATPVDEPADGPGEARPRSRNRRGKGGRGGGGGRERTGGEERTPGGRTGGSGGSGGGQSGGRTRKAVQPIEATMPSEPLDLDDADLKRRGGRERKGRPVGRYMMAVSVGPSATQIAVLEGRNLIEHYVSRPADDIAQIHGNIYLGRVQNVLPGMEAAFIDIGTPKNAVLYRGDVQYDAEDIVTPGQARIEQILKPRQTILCQVTKNPIAHKGARLTQEVSLPGRVVVLIPNSTTYGISKRLADDERKRLRNILDRVRPKGHGLIVRTAADGVTAEEIERDVLTLQHQWEQIEALAQKTQAPALLYREPDMAVRVIREELNQNYRSIVIDDPALYEEVRSYVGAISPGLVDRVQLYDQTVEPLTIFERYHVHEQLHRALDKKVWLPSGGSLIIEHTEALTVIDVNTGKNVGSKSLEETVYRNNLEAAEEIAKQLRLRDIGGIIVIDFIDMEIAKNRDAVIKAFRDALARDKTRTQVFDISDLGLVEMTRKRIGEGLLESFTSQCPECEGRGLKIDQDLLA